MSITFEVKPPVDPKQPAHYVNNEQFKKALTEFYESRKQAELEGKERPQLQNYIGECFLKIAQGLASKHNFRNYSYINDMVSEAVVICIKNVDSFDPSRGTSAFAYFTQCVWYSFLGHIKNEKKQEKTKRDLFFKGDYDTFSIGEDDAEFQLSYSEFVKSLGTDDEKYISPAEKKRLVFESKKTPISEMFE